MKLSINALLFVMSAAYLMGLGLSVSAQAVATGPSASDRQSFNELFESKLRTALRTSDGEDDLALLDELMSVAEQIADEPGIQGVIYIESITLAARGGDIESMLEAADLLETIYPGHEAASNENLLNLAARAYRDAPRTGRERVGEPYLELLLSEAEAQAEAEDYRQAILHMRQASSVARSIESDLSPKIDARLDRYTLAYSLANRIELLTSAIEKNPKNKPAAKELVDLLLIKRNDPSAAKAYVDLVGDPNLSELVGLCARRVDESTAAQAVRVGDWYVGLSRDQSDEYAEPMLRRARAWYARFFETYPRQDTLAVRVRSMDELAAGRLDRIVDARGPAVEETADAAGEWIDLLAEPYDPTQHIRGREDRLKVKDGEIAIEYAGFTVPLKPGSAYEIRCTVTVNRVRLEKRSAFSVSVPIGQAQYITARYFVDDETVARVLPIRTPPLIENPPKRIGRQSVLTFQVAELVDGRYGFAMLLDGIAASRWQGTREELLGEDAAEMLEELGELDRGFHFYANSDLIIHKLEYRARD